MKKSEVYKFYRERGLAGPNGGVITQIAVDAKVSPQRVSQWDDLLPEIAARRLNEKHGDELPFDPTNY